MSNNFSDIDKGVGAGLQSFIQTLPNNSCAYFS
uniref:Uncharacterized protein n=1 Tax=Arundo donax TaxID=35708 RepID=A0A0A8YLT5_ARUDO